MLDGCADSSYCDAYYRHYKQKTEEKQQKQPKYEFWSIEKSTHGAVVDEINDLLLYDNIRDVEVVSLKYIAKESSYKAIIKVYYK